MPKAKKGLPCENRALLDLSHIFNGVQIAPQKKLVKARIHSHQHHPAVKKLVAEFGINPVCQVSLNLLKKGKFSSATPGPTPAPVSHNEKLQENSAGTTLGESAEQVPTSLIEPAAVTAQDELFDQNTLVKYEPDVTDTSKLSIPSAVSNDRLLSADEVISSLLPLYLDFKLQHTVITAAQQILEDALYKFGSRLIREIVQGKGWDCAQCVELNDWAKLLRRHKNVLPQDKVKALDKPLNALLDSIIAIRHTAVHRSRVPAKRLEGLLFDAELFSMLLEDDECARALSRIRGRLSKTIDKLMKYKALVQEKLMEISQHRRAQDAQLRLREHHAVSLTLREVEEFENATTMESGFLSEDPEQRVIQNKTFSAGHDFDSCDTHSGQPSFRLCSTCVNDLRQEGQEERRRSVPKSATVSRLTMPDRSLVESPCDW